ncbi:MAG: hypothetical protein QM516_13585, partial [Limnohabitans sp.]|nr:hypothetical protein [Limnohabitans sp.]
VVTTEIGPAPLGAAAHLLRTFNTGVANSLGDAIEPPPSDPEREKANARAEEEKAKERRLTRDERKARAQAAQKDELDETDPETESRSRDETDSSQVTGESDGPQMIGAELDGTGEAPIPENVASLPLEASNYRFAVQSDLSPIWMTSLWRRLFIPRLAVDPYEIDPLGTVEAAARIGRILVPKMRTRRLNSARLLLLVDAAPAMIPWHPTSDIIVETCQREAERFSHADIAFFATAPGDRVYQTAQLSHPRSLVAIIEEFDSAPIVILGAAGAARPASAREGRQMGNFLTLLRERPPGPLVWINPMPQEFWAGSLMDEILQLPNMRCVELGEDSLLEVIDALRGLN